MPRLSPFTILVFCVFAGVLCASVAVPAQTLETGRASASSSTAVTKILVADFSGRVADAPALSKMIADRLSARSYFKSSVVTGRTRERLSALLTGDVRDRALTWALLNTRGSKLASGKIGLERDIASDPDRAQVASLVVDEVVRSIPYRGLIGKDLGDGHFEINLGSSVGLILGQRLRVFDFQGEDFASSRRDLGFVEVKELRESSAVVEDVSGDTLLAPLQKLAFDERARGMTAVDPAPSKGHIALGGGSLSLASDVPAARFDALAYRVSAAPAVTIGVRYGKFELNTLFAQAQSSTSDLIFTEFSLTRGFWEFVRGSWRLRFAAGLRWAHYGVTVKTGGAATPSSDSVSPHAILQGEYALSGPLSILLGAEVNYPILVSGFDASSPLFSYGGGFLVGGHVDFNPRWGLDLGANLKSFRRPVEGQSAIQERSTLLFSTLKMRF